MKVSLLATLIVLPMLASIGLYSYSFISTRWSYLDQNYIKSSTTKTRQRPSSNRTSDDNIPSKLEKMRYAFRSRYGLFGYCLDYQWIYLLTLQSQRANGYESRQSSPSHCERCESSQSVYECPETRCCMKRCDNKPDCPSYIDEKDCPRPYNATRYYWPQAHCMWESTWIGNQPISRYLSADDQSPQGLHRYMKRIRYYVMFLLFIAAPLLLVAALLVIFCINCVDRFYSIPFAFVSFISLASFLSGAGGLGLFLYQWIQERIHRPEFAYETGRAEALTVAFNPWLINAERLGLAFWLTVAAVGATLFTTILSCCFCCGLQSEKSKLRFRVDNDVYEIVHMPPYEE